jgi:hypothetical protein
VCEEQSGNESVLLDCVALGWQPSHIVLAASCLQVCVQGLLTSVRAGCVRAGAVRLLRWTNEGGCIVSPEKRLTSRRACCQCGLLASCSSPPGVVVDAPPVKALRCLELLKLVWCAAPHAGPAAERGQGRVSSAAACAQAAILATASAYSQ